MEYHGQVFLKGIVPTVPTRQLFLQVDHSIFAVAVWFCYVQHSFVFVVGGSGSAFNTIWRRSFLNSKSVAVA